LCNYSVDFLSLTPLHGHTTCSPSPDADFDFGQRPAAGRYTNFSHLIFYAFVTIPHQDCIKTITSFIHQFCYQGKKSQSTEHGYAKTKPISIPFATKLFTPHFLCIYDNSPPRLHKNHNLTYSPILLPRLKTNPPNLGKPKPNQEQFLLQPNFADLIFYAFVTIQGKIAQKP